ncbi:family 2 putative glycosyltransferase [Cercophora samala]|uniref:Family 2 putative glycosyltransferase n=1 Tax=Cercophora samala TaxID=330535 RepID=A0AA39ZC55_9PEZI|nr:family 2 putative glycosyltransferase [Cercophora samala]
MSTARRAGPSRARDPPPSVPTPPEPVRDDLYVPSRVRSNKVLRGLFNAFILALCGYAVDWFATWYSEYDYWLYWFIMLATWRYARFILNCIGWVLYKPAPVPKTPSYTPNRDVTVILPTIDPTGIDFQECISTCAQNEPAQIIVITAGDELLVKTKKAVENYIKLYPKVNFIVDRALIASKRAQVAVAVPLVDTAITVMLDDHVFWKKNFLKELLAPFEDPEIGLVGTNKKVRRLPDLSIWRRIWNMLGATYLYRHNFEVRSANYWDGGAFVISARTCAMRTRIIQDPEYLTGYVDERFFFGLCGPLNPDDDNYNTRFAVRKGWRIKFQYTDNAEIETTVGVADPVHKKFLGQCSRWARTTWRSNPCSLFTDGSVWAFQPYCVYAVYLTSFTNFSLFTDAALLTFYSWTRNWTLAGLSCLLTWIMFVKFVKVFEYYKRHPMDFWTFPFYVMFAYFHSLIKLWALLTFWDHAWTGRNLGAIKTNVNPAGTESGATAGAAAVATRLHRSLSVVSLSPSLLLEKEGLRTKTAWMERLGSSAVRFQKREEIFGGNLVNMLQDLKTLREFVLQGQKSTHRTLEQQDTIFDEVRNLTVEAENLEKQYEQSNSNETRNQTALAVLRGRVLLLEQKQRELFRVGGLELESPPLSPTAVQAINLAQTGSGGEDIPALRVVSPDSVPRPSFLTGWVKTPDSRPLPRAPEASGKTSTTSGSDPTPRANTRGINPNNFGDSFPPTVGEPNPLGGGTFNVPTMSGKTLSSIPKEQSTPTGISPGFNPAPRSSAIFSPVPVPRDSPSGFTPLSKEGGTPGGDPPDSGPTTAVKNEDANPAYKTPTRPAGARRASKDQSISELQQNAEESLRRFHETLGSSPEDGDT